MLYVVCVDGLIGAGKSTLMKRLSTRKGSITLDHPVLGSYHIIEDRQIMIVKENLALYDVKNCLTRYLTDPTLTPYFSLKVNLDKMALLHTALEKALEHGVRVLVIERHLVLVQHTFAVLGSRRNPEITR